MASTPFRSEPSKTRSGSRRGNTPRRRRRVTHILVQCRIRVVGEVSFVSCSRLGFMCQVCLYASSRQSEQRNLFIGCYTIPGILQVYLRIILRCGDVFYNFVAVVSNLIFLQYSGWLSTDTTIHYLGVLMNCRYPVPGTGMRTGSHSLRARLPPPFPISPKAHAILIMKTQSKIEYIEHSRLTCVPLVNFSAPSYCICILSSYCCMEHYTPVDLRNTNNLRIIM